MLKDLRFLRTGTWPCPWALWPLYLGRVLDCSLSCQSKGVWEASLEGARHFPSVCPHTAITHITHNTHPPTHPHTTHIHTTHTHARMCTQPQLRIFVNHKFNVAYLFSQVLLVDVWDILSSLVFYSSPITLIIPLTYSWWLFLYPKGAEANMHILVYFSPAYASCPHLFSCLFVSEE